MSAVLYIYDPPRDFVELGERMHGARSHNTTKELANIAAACERPGSLAAGPLF